MEEEERLHLTRRSSHGAISHRAALATAGAAPLAAAAMDDLTIEVPFSTTEPKGPWVTDMVAGDREQIVELETNWKKANGFI